MIDFNDIGRLPAANDNCAIAIKTLAAGTLVQFQDAQFTLSHTILEGHRFAIRLIPINTPLRSWGFPFGIASSDIMPGAYLCNKTTLKELATRNLTFVLPTAPNFSDEIAPFQFSAAAFQAAPPLPHKEDNRTFEGFRRPGQRGVGTRNTIVLLGTNALVASFVRQLAAQTKELASGYANIGDITAVAHTEGSHANSHNRDLLLRTLAGFIIHPNVGAVLVLDAGPTGVTNEMLRDYMLAHHYPLNDVPHHFFSVSGSFAAELDRATAVLTPWLEQVNNQQRTAEPLSALKIALQCGGSDAFSGVSGNPLAAWVAKEIIQVGGTAVLAETDELLGAESYTLQKVRNLPTAERFLQMVARFQTWAGWHGHSAEGNPSGGNIYRGLYNIALKSLGAAAKRHPDVRLDHVIEYGAPTTEPGFYFMDSPGNDLESIAGQVAAGCNLIYFVTGNGSITNFPFVPTIKIVTTSDRYKLLAQEMDVNAGAYLDGQAMAELGQNTLDLSLAIASGQASVGENAGHAQVQIWREWQQSQKRIVATSRKRFDQRPLPIHTPANPPNFTFSAWKSDHGTTSDRVGLIIPTSLCSGQIARMAVQRLNNRPRSPQQQLSRFATLVHTEGCGSSTQQEFVDTMLGYMTHPLVTHCLLLEHGCEKTHNSFWRQQMQQNNLDPAQFGWASVQMDGGIDNALKKIEYWFTEQLKQAPAPQPITAGLEAVRLGLVTDGESSAATAVALAHLTQFIAAAGGTFIVPEQDPLLRNRTYLQTTLSQTAVVPSPTLAYAQKATQAGFHIMATATDQWSETLSGLGATGVELVLALINTRPQTGHPLIPVLQVAIADTAVAQQYATDFDATLVGASTTWPKQLLQLMQATLSRTVTPRLLHQQNVDFQVTRGLMGISL